MMKGVYSMSKKLIALLLASMMAATFALTACEPKENTGGDETTVEDTAGGEEGAGETEASE